MAENNFEFGTSMRGYNRHEVDRAISNLDSEISILRTENYELQQNYDELAAELRVLKAKVRRMPAKPNYSVLGAQFEEVLRLAEEKAEKLVSDATQEAEQIRKNSEAESGRVLREASQRADKLVSDATARA